MKPYLILINGQFFVQKTTGQQRYAKEILSELDKIIQKNEISIIVPRKAIVPEYKNFNIIRYGRINNRLWEQLCLPFYLMRHHCRVLSFCNTTPFIRPGPTVIHDTLLKEHPEYFTTLKGKIAYTYYNLNSQRIIKSTFPIITVTQFSKKRISELYNVPETNITVIGNAWQHFEKIKENDAFFLQNKNIKKGEYYFSLGSLAKQKNFEWINENARLFPNQQYVIAGRPVANYKVDMQSLRNIHYTGYISDEDIKALMKNCKAFIFPSLFEGFGIPPLEALSVGAKVVSSDAACLPEIFENAVYYINPTNPSIDIEQLISNPLSQSSADILSKYSWNESAKKMYSFINKNQEVQNAE